MYQNPTIEQPILQTSARYRTGAATLWYVYTNIALNIVAYVICALISEQVCCEIDFVSEMAGYNYLNQYLPQEMILYVMLRCTIYIEIPCCVLYVKLMLICCGER